MVLGPILSTQSNVYQKLSYKLGEAHKFQPYSNSLLIVIIYKIMESCLSTHTTFYCYKTIMWG